MSKISVIGIGPGSLDELTPRAAQAIESAEVVAGYNTYIKLIEKILVGKKIIGRAMMQEVERCRLAIEETLSGKNVERRRGSLRNGGACRRDDFELARRQASAV